MTPEKALPCRAFFCYAPIPLRGDGILANVPGVQQGTVSRDDVDHTMNDATSNSDPRELDKFGEVAHRWWDPNSEFRPLHDINPARLAWIDGHAGLKGKHAIDVGCGGGLLSEGMAALGARVTGIDLSEKALGIARLHLYESGHVIDYRLVSAEDMAAEAP